MYIYYRNKESGKIEARYTGCDTNSTVFRDESKYERFEDEMFHDLDVMPDPRPLRENTNLEDLLIEKGVITQEDVDGLKSISKALE
jgi:hypothetical protein